MEDFQTYAHEKKMNLLKSCNDILQKLNIKVYGEKPVEDFDDRYIHDERWSGDGGEQMRFEHNYALIFNDILKWLRKEWLWLPLKWGRGKSREIPKLLYGGHQCIEKTKNIFNFYDLTYFFAEFFLKNSRRNCIPDFHDLQENIKFIKSDFSQLREWIKENRAKRHKDIKNKFYEVISPPCEELILMTKDFITLINQKFDLDHNLTQLEYEYVMGNSFLIQQFLEYLINESIRKIYIEDYRNLSINPQDFNYFLNYFEESELFTFNLI
ncbi:MAG: hypothetical protein ACTSQF_10395, partial [Candidatus Heimdallarchaeaceae archaeon]